MTHPKFAGVLNEKTLRFLASLLPIITRGWHTSAEKGLRAFQYFFHLLQFSFFLPFFFSFLLPFHFASLVGDTPVEKGAYCEPINFPFILLQFSIVSLNLVLLFSFQIFHCSLVAHQWRKGPVSVRLSIWFFFFFNIHFASSSSFIFLLLLFQFCNT